MVTGVVDDTFNIIQDLPSRLCQQHLNTGYHGDIVNSVLIIGWVFLDWFRFINLF